VDPTDEARPSVRVLTVDDQEVFLRAARELIAATPGFEQVGQATSGEEALRLAAELRPDFILLDVRMPGMDGVETARRLAGTESEALVVLISMEPVAAPSPTTARGPVPQVRKQELSTRRLAELWKTHRGAPRAPAADAAEPESDRRSAR
jgi:two-component system, NarL family, invasion response regulator UvrY